MTKYKKAMATFVLASVFTSSSWAGWWCTVKCTAAGMGWIASCSSATGIVMGVSAMSVVSQAVQTGNPVDTTVETGAEIGDFMDACAEVVDQQIEECVEECNE